MFAFFVGISMGILFTYLYFFCIEATSKQSAWFQYHNITINVYERKSPLYTLYYAETLSKDGRYRKNTGYYFSSDDATEAAFENARAYEKTLHESRYDV